MDLGVHLPLMEFGDEGQSLDRLRATVDAAREGGFAAVSANDHFVFSTPWLDGLTALAAVLDRCEGLSVATTLSLVSLRGPVQLAKALTALDILSGGRLVAGVGPGSSQADYELTGVPFEERWKRFDEAVATLRALVGRGPERLDVDLRPRPHQDGGIPVWLGSWGSEAGLRRVARLGDGWLASAYNTTPERFAAARDALAVELSRNDRQAEGFPTALATMWTWVTEDAAERERVFRDVLAPLLRRDPDELAGQVCVGSAEQCAQLLSRYARAGCGRVYLWPLGDERRQLELVAGEVAPMIGGR